MSFVDEHFEVKEPNTGAYVGFDLRFYPLYVTHWYGAPTTELVDQVLGARAERVFKQARAEGARVVQVSDLTNFETPAATIRKYLGEKGGRQDAEYDDVFMGYVIVIPNAVVRGVITALRWVVGEQVKPCVFVSSIEAAFRIDFPNTFGVDLRDVAYAPRSA